MAVHSARASLAELSAFDGVLAKRAEQLIIWLLIESSSSLPCSASETIFEGIECTARHVGLGPSRFYHLRSRGHGYDMGRSSRSSFGRVDNVRVADWFLDRW